ncbi:hypothetical protein ACWD2L_06160 [Streptomyces sp. NPDC002754]
MTETTTEGTPKRGRKPDPLVAYRKAHDKAERARKAYEKVQALATAKAEAEEAEQAAYLSLQKALGDIPVPPAA